MMLKNLITADWEALLIKWWHNISPVSKKAFLYVFLMINFIFAWHTLTFIPDNHSLGMIKYGVSIDYQFGAREGRFVGGILQQLTGGELLPVFNDVFCFAFFALSLILLANYWRVPKTVFCYTLFSLFIALMPYILPWVYFVRHQTYFINIFMMIGSLLLLVKPNKFRMILSSLVFCFCLGTYFAMIQYIGIAFFGRLLTERFFEHCSFKDFCKKYEGTFWSIFFGVSLFIVIELFLCLSGEVLPRPETSIEWPSLQKITTILASYVITTPYMVLGLKYILIMPFTICLFLGVIKQDYLFLFLSLSVFLICNFTNLIGSEEYIYATRIRFWGTPWFYALFAVLLLKRGNISKNLVLFLMIVSILYSALQDMKWQKSFYFEEMQEMKHWSKLIDSIKSHPDFDGAKKYRVLMFSNPSHRLSFIKNYSDISNLKHIETNHYIFGYLAQVNTKDAFDFFEKESYVSEVHEYENLFDFSIKTGVNLCARLEAFDFENIVYIKDSDIFIFATDLIRENIKKQCANYKNN